MLQVGRRKQPAAQIAEEEEDKAAAEIEQFRVSIWLLGG